MVTLARLEADLQYQIEYEALWRSPSPTDLRQYINWAYADIATFSLALVALRRWDLKHNEAGLKKFPAQLGGRAIEWEFRATGLLVPYHILWERSHGSNLFRFSLQPSVQVRPEILLQNSERQSRAPSSIDEHPASAPRLRIFPENRLATAPSPNSFPGPYPAQYYYHNGRLWLYPEPNPDTENHYGAVWVFGAFVPRSGSHAVFKELTNTEDEPELPVSLATLIPDIAFYYWARGITDLYPLAEQKRQNALQLALVFRQQMIQLGVQGAPFTENTLNPEVIEQLGGRLRNTPSRRGARARATSGGEA